MKGEVKWFDQKKGFGFLKDAYGKDIFVHASALPDGVQVYEGTVVEFDIGQSSKGTVAINVRVESAI